MAALRVQIAALALSAESSYEQGLGVAHGI